MARKLTKQELAEARGADFPIPDKPDKPEKHAGGRPQKAEEPMRVCSFRLTEKAYRKIKTIAASQGKSSGDLLSAYIDTLPDEVKL